MPYLIENKKIFRKKNVIKIKDHNNKKTNNKQVMGYMLIIWKAGMKMHTLLGFFVILIFKLF